MKDMLKEYYKYLNVDEKVFEYCNSVEEKLKDRFAKIDAVSENLDKKINLFVSELDFLDDQHRIINRRFSIV
mgnify:CR=1 FL=1